MDPETFIWTSLIWDIAILVTVKWSFLIIRAYPLNYFCLVSSHYLKHRWLVSWTPRNKFQWNINENTAFFILMPKICIIVNVVCKMGAILFQGLFEWKMIQTQTIKYRVGNVSNVTKNIFQWLKSFCVSCIREFLVLCLCIHYITGLVVNCGISNTVVLEIP